MAPSPEDQKMRELAQQLRQPHGAEGVQVGQVMHESNIGMTRACFAGLEARAGETLLEIGHGNGMHVPELLGARPGLSYQGLELSALMHDEALQRNRDEVAHGRAAFARYDGSAFPFASERFEAVMTVNTIYFLPEPAAFLREVHRVLKPQGRFGLAFAGRDFMRELPFVQHGFQLYQPDEVCALLAAAGFGVSATDAHEERVPSKAKPGTTTRRFFTVIRAVKAD